MSLLLRNVAALDGTMERAKPCDITLEGGRIAAIMEPGAGDGDEVIEGRGRTAVLPGFVNTHTHAAMTLLRGLGEEAPLMEWLKEKVWPVEAGLNGDYVYWGSMQAMAEMLSRGVTAFGDMYFFMDEVAGAARESGMRCGLSRGLIWKGDEADFAARLEEQERLYNDWNGFEGRMTVQWGPHAPYTVPPEQLARVAEAAGNHEAGVHLHWLENQWEAGYIRDELGSDPVTLLEEAGLLDGCGLILAHGVWCPEEDIKRLVNRQATIVHNPKSNLKLGSGIAPLTAMLDAGLPVALGTDGAASNNQLDVWAEMRTAALLHKGVRQDPTAVPAKAALRMATLEGNRALGFTDVGLIHQGWEADLQLVDLDQCHYNGWTPENLATYVVYAGDSSDVTHTIVQGRKVYERGVFPELNLMEIRSESARARKELVS
ncbi:MAG: amidohydrolase [Synergistales bacterium]|nr:amidohydrolase [Synergistales bacterium]